jgi:hypothetical protein
VKVTCQIVPGGRYVLASDANFSAQWKVRSDGTLIDALGERIAEQDREITAKVMQLHRMRAAYAALVGA